MQEGDGCFLCVMEYRVSGTSAEAEPLGRGHFRAGRKLVTEEADGSGEGSGRVHLRF